MKHGIFRRDRRRFLEQCAVLGTAALAASSASSSPRSIQIGADLELAHLTSTSDDAILAGARLAIDDINEAGGLLGGSHLELIVRDNRSVPSRGVANAREFSALPDMPAFLCGKYSAVVLEQLPTIHSHGLILLNPWSAADAIIDNSYTPNVAFRIGLRDSWAIRTMLQYFSSTGLGDIGLMMPATAWGRSSAAAIEKLIPHFGGIRIRGKAWHLWGGDMDIVASYHELRAAGARAILLVANEAEGAMLVRGLARMPAGDRLPLVSHWGITGGDFATMCGTALDEVDLQVVQTYSFHTPRNKQARRLGDRAAAMLGHQSPLRMPSAIGVAHAYDLVHLLAQAITHAGSSERTSVRDALERLPAHEGVIKRYDPAFTANNHEGLRPTQVFLARFNPEGQLLPSNA